MFISIGLIGLALIIVVLWDVFETIVLPRRVTRRFRLTRAFYRAVWIPWSAIAVRLRKSKRRETFLGFFGPLSLLALLVLWAVTLVFGFALLHFAFGSRMGLAAGHAGFFSDLYYSGTTFFTLGLGDITPTSPAARTITVIEASVGFGLLALVIGYFPVLYQAFSRREVNISMLDARAGTPPTAAELLRDWILPHEMIHLALPEVGDEHLWLAEGLATYVEGVARVQAGNLDAVEFWGELVRQMPKGVPLPGDRGLDQTHTWGRTYWGGALFCLEADVEIHERTGNRFGLQDALRAIARASGGYQRQWSIDRVLQTGDEATGVHVLTDLYVKMRDQPAAPDLAALWRRVGIDTSDDRERLDESGPGAALRAAITKARLYSADRE